MSASKESAISLSNCFPLRIGVMGNQKSGKSSLINRILGNDLANATDEFEQEMAMEYVHSNNSQVFFLDIPTFRFRAVDDYIKRIRGYIEQCDIILYVYLESFDQNDVDIYTKIVEKKRKGNVFVVKTKLSDAKGGDRRIDKKSAKADLSGVTNCNDALLPAPYLVSNYKKSGGEALFSSDDHDYNRLLSDMTSSIDGKKRRMLRGKYCSPIKKKFEIQSQRLLGEWRVGTMALLPTLAGGLGGLPIPVLPLFLNFCILFEAILFMGRPLGVFARNSMFGSRLKCFHYSRKSYGFKLCLCSMIVGEVVRFFIVGMGPACSSLLFSLSTWGLLTGMQDQFLEYGRLKMEQEDELRVF